MLVVVQCRRVDVIIICMDFKFTKLSRTTVFADPVERAQNSTAKVIISGFGFRGCVYSEYLEIHFGGIIGRVGETGCHNISARTVSEGPTPHLRCFLFSFEGEGKCVVV